MQPGEKITVTSDMTIKAVWNYTKDEQVDISAGYKYEAELAELVGARSEDNATASEGKSVGYMSAGASVKFTVNAASAGKATLILLAANVGTWSWSGTTYDSNTPIDGAMTIKVNGTNISVAGKGINMADQGNWIQVNFGEIDLQAGANEILLECTAQTINLDALVLLSSIALS